MEEKCAALELEIEKKKSEYESLEAKFRALEVKKIEIEEEAKILKRRNGELEERIARIEEDDKVVCKGERVIGRVVDLTAENDEEDKVVQLVVENRVLECGKKRAESEVEVWKEKFRELESQVLRLEKESLVLGGTGCQLEGKIKLGLGFPDVDSFEETGKKGMSEAIKHKDGSDVGTNLDRLQTKEKMADCDEAVRDSAGVASTRHFPGEGNVDMQAAGTPSTDTPYNSLHAKGEKRGIHSETGVEYGSRVRKRLSFGEKGSPSKKMAPSTPAGARLASVGVIHISDSDDEPDINPFHMPIPKIQGNRVACVSANRALGGTVENEKEMTTENSLKRTLPDQSDEEDMKGCKDNLPFILTPKRKRASNIVTSDSESDDDDIVPICKLKRKHLQKLIHDPTGSHFSGAGNITESVTPRRRRLVTLRQCEEKGEAERNSPSNMKTCETKNYAGIPTNEDVEDDEMDEVGSDSEGESLGGFIVDSSDVSDCDDASSESEGVSDSNLTFDEIISRIRRNKDHKSKWEFEADMLAALGKDPELCMKAVCALYRQQTSEEKSVKETIYSNQRGFSQCDALRGTTVAEFLTDGDPQGELKKSVKELEEYDPKALELCKTLATHYSKQLFAIYKNKEDPFFLPSQHNLL